MHAPSKYNGSFLMIPTNPKLTSEAGLGLLLARSIDQVFLFKRVTSTPGPPEKPLDSTQLCEATAIVRNESICAKRRRLHLSHTLKQHLEHVFSMTPHPSRAECDVIAKSCQLSPRQVRVWVCMLL
ncbi:mating_type_MTLa1 [Candidozyma pseudohaemuli]|uniref:Mating_type_MTLa1 n=1 Tax=Candidozyma pseudohaemuli TaxID=418784 RepID=A0A2P7YFM0_9ASCO|nr:mating_type_MTLa1 [[Candida] pseudohaemulonii]PSK34762.1 mating_type_MTLa1 [[Candida] pseudohaemulonii]